MQYGDIASRPYSPYMIEMANRLPEKDRKEIKSNLINDFMKIMSLYVHSKINSRSENGYHLFVLKKHR